MFRAFPNNSLFFFYRKTQVNNYCYSRSNDTIMTIASREIVNTFLNGQRQKRQSRGKQHGCLRAVRNGITVVKNASSRRENSGLRTLTIGMRIFPARCRIVEPLVRTHSRYYRRGKTRETWITSSK